MHRVIVLVVMIMMMHRVLFGGMTIVMAMRSVSRVCIRCSMFGVRRSVFLLLLG